MKQTMRPKATNKVTVTMSCRALRATESVR